MGRLPEVEGGQGRCDLGPEEWVEVGWIKTQGNGPLDGFTKQPQFSSSAMREHRELSVVLWPLPWSVAKTKLGSCKAYF